jgi:hypothetical protein
MRFPFAYYSCMSENSLHEDKKVIFAEILEIIVSNEDHT